MNHICFVLDSYPPSIGGAETALQQIVEGLAKRNFNVTIVTVRFRKEDPPYEGRDGITIVRVRIPRILRRMWFCILAFPSVIRYGRASDIILGTTYGGVLPAFIGSVFLRKKRVLMVHEVMGKKWFRFERNRLKAFLYFLTEKILVRLRFHRVVAVSEYTRRELLYMGVPPEILEVIYHGAPADIHPLRRNRDEVRMSLGVEKEQYLFLTYGRLGVTKGFQYLAGAISQVIREVPRARFVMVLSSYDRRMRKAVQEAIGQVPAGMYRLFDSVSRELLIEYIHAADCIVIPSLSEGFGFAAIEACIAGKTIVATNAGALPEVVYGRHIFVEPASNEELARGCIAASEGRTSYSEPGSFRWSDSIEKWAALFRSLQ